MSVMRHWLAEDGGMLRIVRDEEELVDYEDEGWTVSGPWVAEAELSGAVEALNNAELALSYLDATPLNEPGVRAAHLGAAREAITGGLRGQSDEGDRRTS